MKRSIRISLDEQGVGQIVIFDGVNRINVAPYTCGLTVEAPSGDLATVTLTLLPMALEMDLPAELKVLVDEIPREDTT